MGLSAGLRVRYIADQVLWNNNDELEDAPDYSLWHFSVRKAFLKYFEIQVGVDNIGDVRLASFCNVFATYVGFSHSDDYAFTNKTNSRGIRVR